ncbi:uncharacterized protein LOC135692582 [Rhopilema esculentum]|uniref:uncharacterized protein LOC135692582 n=1 Tax=Rhopilema esculentum TaxID=499914 RepID=UPI0031CE1912
MTSFLDGKKGRSLDNIIAKLSKVKSSRKGDRILLISEKNNACLSLSSDEGEDGDSDLHQCGYCKEMFTNLTLYISHKIERPCRTGPAGKNHQWNNDEMEAENEEKERGISNKESKIENDLMQDYHKKKHDRKGMARKLNMAEFENSVVPHDDLRVVDSENPIIVVEPNSDRRFGNESDITDTRSGSKSFGREPISPLKQKESDDSQTTSRNMPYLERIPSYAFDSPTMYPHLGVPGFLPRNTDRPIPNHGNDVEAENHYRDRVGIKNYERDSREPWSFSKKHPSPFRGSGELPSPYGSYVHSNLYTPPYNMSYPHPYSRYSNIQTTQASGKVCCSSAYTVPAHYPPDLYTIPIEEYNKSMYGKGPSQPGNSASAEPDREKVSKEWTPTKVPNSLDQPDQVRAQSSDDKDGSRNDEVQETEADGKDPAEKEQKDEGNEEEETASQMTEESQSANNSEAQRICSKDNNILPSPSSRLEMQESNSQVGSSRSVGSTPSPSESLISSSNQSGEQIVSPSQEYEPGTFQYPDDDTSKQSAEPESPIRSISGADCDVSSPRAKQSSSDPALRGSENITPQDMRPSFIQTKRKNSAELPSFERPAEAFQGDTSPPNDPSWRHSKQVYRCPLCAKIFPFKSKLQRHVLVHTGIKPYKCNVCGRGFTQQIDLQRHLTRHTGEKPFKCHLCKAQFIRADNLRKHAKDTHFVNIEEPIRKRRRKTTGSDTVLPPLEVAIAMAINETEKNGGRVLGRAGNRGSRTARKDRMPSVDDEERRSDQSNEAFSRPTMGTVPSHQYPVGPPTMGFPPHGPGMPPFPRMPSDMYDPGMHDRGSPPPRLPHPPRYHPGSMVFQPRTDRFMERPYFGRPSGDVPSMYWASQPRHTMISHGELPPHVQARERFKSDASESASSVFETRDDMMKHERPLPVSRNDEKYSMCSSNDMRTADSPLPIPGRGEPERLGPLPDDANNGPTKSLPPGPPDMFHRSSSGRPIYPPEERGQHIAEERTVHILDERGRFAQERARSAEDILKPPSESSPRHHSPNHVSEDRVPRGPDERPPFSGDERFNISPQRSYAPTSGPQSIGRHMEPDERSIMHVEERNSSSIAPPYSGESRLHLRVQDSWRGYDLNNKDHSTLNAGSPTADSFIKPKNESPSEKTNGYRTKVEEMTAAPS